MKIDYLNVTVPENIAAKVVDEVSEILDFCGATQASNELYRLGQSGTAKIKIRNGYTLFGFSGSALDTFREYDQYTPLLWVFGSHPHRVTSADIALDVSIDARTVLNSLWRRSRGPRGIRLTRKRLQPKHVTRFSRDCLYDDGATGTVYLGNRTSEVYCKVYDKRNELLERTGDDIGYPLVRYELTVTSKMRISLKDLADPSPMFWHFMREVLPPPADVSAWVAGGQGFTMPKREKLMPADKLKQVVGESDTIERWIKYADEVGPNGREFLMGLLRRRIMAPTNPNQQTESTTRVVGDQVDPGE